MSGSDKRVLVASVEDADESGNIIEGTSKYAASVASPIKEKPNTGRTRRERTRRDTSPPPPINPYTDSDSTAHPAAARRHSTRPKSSKEKDRPFREEIQLPVREKSRKAIVSMRPPPPHRITTPQLPTTKREDASYYGVSPIMMAASAPRPRANTSQQSQQRPMSYYGPPPHPPMANSRYYPPPSTSPLPTSYPPQPWASAGPVVYPAPPPMVSQPPHDYYSTSARSLESRFGPRPQSAIGHKLTRAIEYEEEEPVEHDKALARRSGSHRKSSKTTDMGPPPRPPSRTRSARPSSLPFRPPPHKRAVGFEDDDLVGSDDLFRDISPRHYSYTPPVPIPAAVAPRSRRSSIDTRSVSYDLGAYHTEVARGAGRRSSLYIDRSVSSGSGYEDKMKSASAYQDDVTGGSMPLTAETLRKANKHPSSSRSTRSSGSHEESDYRQSATTRTTRSSANDEDVTIRVKGTTTLKVGGTEMQCHDAEINIISRAPSGGYGGGSDGSGYLDQDDRRTRIDRPVMRARAASQAGSYSRTAPYPMYGALPYDSPSSYEPSSFDPSYEPFQPSYYPQSQYGRDDSPYF